MSRTTGLWLIVVPAALVVGAAATALVLISDHTDVPRLTAALTAVLGSSFIVAGLIAHNRRPLNRTGLLLIAVGFTWFVASGLMAANDSVPWTIGVALGAVPGGFLIHLLLAYPSGRLESSWERFLVVSGYVLVTVGSFSLLPFDPDPAMCDECPDNAFLVSDNHTAGDVFTSLLQILAVAFLLAVVVTLLDRWQRSSPAARRALTPVLLAGGVTLCLFAVMIATQSMAPTVSKASWWIAMAVLIEIPFLFLWGLLQSRLARADISRALADGLAGGAQGWVRRLLHDPSAEVLYSRKKAPGEYVDAAGRPRDAEARDGRAVTHIDRKGRPLAAIVHDEALLDEPELLEQVAAAVGLEIERDRTLLALQASERRSRALVEAMPDNMFRISADGIFLDIEETPAGRPVHADIGASIYDYPVPRELVDRVMAAGRRALETGELQTIEWELGTTKDHRYQEGRFMPSGEREFFLVVRDVTDRKRQEAEQAALHRVALAVAIGSQEVFDLVAEEVGQLLGAHAVKLLRYAPGGEEAAMVGYWQTGGRPPDKVSHSRPSSIVGSPMHFVYETGRPLRVDFDTAARPEIAERLRKHGINSFVAAPIRLGGRLWGVVAASLEPPESFWRGAEEHLAAFTQLVALGLANEEARGELAASRARIVSAGDEERRRLERNLHDGAQQRLVSVSVSLQLAQSKLAGDPGAARELLADANADLALALEELRELARGIHPAVLTDRGLGPALASLADRAPLPVELEGLPRERLPRQVEAAAYYLIAEALANVAKHADASSVTVRVARYDGRAVVEIVDDGVGGADPMRGSGLRGLADRIEALDGWLEILSPAGEGTAIRAEIPVVLAAVDSAEQRVASEV